MADIFSEEIADLLKEHLTHLLSSAISLEVIKERGYKTIFGTAELKDKGFTRPQQRHPGILIPIHGVDGLLAGYQYRPDRPRENYNKDGKVKKVKYENPSGSSIRLDVPPRCLKDLGNPNVPIFFTEGIKKTDALATAGACVVGMTGVWGFKGKNIFGASTVLSDFDYIAFKDRDIYLVFDSDSKTNSQVRAALNHFTAICTKKQGNVKIVNLPAGPKGEKVGADDFLAQGHTLQDIVALAVHPNFDNNPTLESGFKNLFTVEDGVLGYFKTEGQTVHTIPLADFAAGIKQVVTRDNGIEQVKSFMIAGKESNGQDLPEVEVPTAKFESLSWITDAWDVRAVISTDTTAKAKIRAAILSLSKDIAQRRYIYSHTGFRVIDGHRTFLTNGGAIGVPGVDVELDDDLENYNLPQPPEDPKEALKASLEFLSTGNRKVLLPLWAGMYLAPLAEIVDSNFTLFLVGLSGSFKSGITALALNHYGHKFSYNNLPASWTSTQNNLEYLLFLLKDMPLVIDDWAPGQDSGKAKELEAKAERIIRAQANRQGRGRMNAEGSSRKTYRPRGLLLTSGEHLPGGHSHTARMFVVEIRKGDIDQEKFFSLDRKKGLLSLAMSAYIQYLIRNWDELQATLAEKVRDWVKLAQKGSQHPRLPTAVAALYAGLNCALACMVEHKVLTRKEAKALGDEGWQIFMAWSLEQSGRVESERPGRRFMDALMALKESGKLNIGNFQDEIPKIPTPGQVNIGWYDKEYNLLLNPEIAYSTVRQFCAGSDEPLTFKQEAVWRDLKEMGLTEFTNGRTRFVCRIFGNLTYVIKIKATAYQDTGYLTEIREENRQAEKGKTDAETEI